VQVVDDDVHERNLVARTPTVGTGEIPRDRLPSSSERLLDSQRPDLAHRDLTRGDRRPVRRIVGRRALEGCGARARQRTSGVHGQRLRLRVGVDILTRLREIQRRRAAILS